MRSAAPDKPGRREAGTNMIVVHQPRLKTSFMRFSCGCSRHRPPPRHRRISTVSGLKKEVQVVGEIETVRDTTKLGVHIAICARPDKPVASWLMARVGCACGHRFLRRSDGRIDPYRTYTGSRFLNFRFRSAIFGMQLGKRHTSVCRSRQSLSFPRSRCALGNL
jgi:hypothetical protein